MVSYAKQIQDKLESKFGEKTHNFRFERDGIFSFDALAEGNADVIRYLKEDAELNFNFLTDVCGVHYPDAAADQQFAVVYHLHNWYENIRIRIKCYLNGENPEINTISNIFVGANWQERETYDFYGITFKGHPQLKRILNMDGMEVFPLRKEYPMEDAGRTDKDDRFFGRVK